MPDDRLEGGTVGMYADRFRWGPFGTAIAHAAMVVILAAFGVSAFTGFEENLDISVGHTAQVGHGTGLSVTAESFKDAYDEMGRPSDYVSHLVVERDGQVVAEQDVRVNEPLRVDGTALHQASFGIAAALRITDQEGAVLFEAPVP
nr:cytochrome c biogenesis protein ResB [Tessaracoccus coleopterorum]